MGRMEVVGLSPRRRRVQTTGRTGGLRGRIGTVFGHAGRNSFRAIHHCGTANGEFYSFLNRAAGLRDFEGIRIQRIGTCIRRLRSLKHAPSCVVARISNVG